MPFCPKKNPDISFVKNGAFFQLFNPSTNFLFETTPLAVKILKQCNGKKSIEEITEKVMKQEGIGASFRKDITAFFAELREKKLVDY